MNSLNPLVDMTQLIVEFKIRALEEGRIAKWIATCTRKPTLWYLSVFSPNAGKYGPEKLRIRTLFTKCFYYRKKKQKKL